MPDHPSSSSITLAAAVAGALFAVAACGGNSGRAATGPAAAPPSRLALGTTGFPGLDWGDSIDAVKAVYPAAEAGPDDLALQATHGGREASIAFMFNGGALIAISASYLDSFASMPACGETFRQVRAELDRTLGDSGEDNLAAYWSSDTASISLACNSYDEDDETASLSMMYTLPEPEEM